MVRQAASRFAVCMHYVTSYVTDAAYPKFGPRILTTLSVPCNRSK